MTLAVIRVQRMVRRRNSKGSGISLNTSRGKATGRLAVSVVNAWMLTAHKSPWGESQENDNGIGE